jgi:hypothetical protein
MLFLGWTIMGISVASYGEMAVLGLAERRTTGIPRLDKRINNIDSVTNKISYVLSIDRLN